jgi:glycosyltransferase involved in cell wall biosynthesis
MKILLAPSNVANQSTSIATGLRTLGHEVEIWNYGASPNGFRTDRVLAVDKTPAAYIQAFVDAIEADFDVFHFHTTRSLIPARNGMPQMWDLPVLRALGKKIIFSFHGSDVRIASHHRAEDEWSFYRFADIPCDEEKIRTRLAIIRPYAHAMTVSSVLDQVYVPGATYLPKSIDLAEYPDPGLSSNPRPLVIHATRRRETKGTDTIEQLLRELQGSLDFDFRILENVSHDELLSQIREADIVVEKLYGGDAGVISLEAMALGKIAVARIRDEVRRQHPTMPVVDANPRTFKQTMENILGSPDLRAHLAAEGRKYVATNHSPEVAATILEKLYRKAVAAGSPPHPDWASDPSERRLESAHQRIQALEIQNAQLRLALEKSRQINL